MPPDRDGVIMTHGRGLCKDTHYEKDANSRKEDGGRGECLEVKVRENDEASFGSSPIQQPGQV